MFIDHSTLGVILLALFFVWCILLAEFLYVNNIGIARRLFGNDDGSLRHFFRLQKVPGGIALAYAIEFRRG